MADTLIGLTGPSGADGANGAAGADGAPGIDGAAGANGINGVNGLSAYEIAVNNGYGFPESVWLSSLGQSNSIEHGLFESEVGSFEFSPQSNIPLEITITGSMGGNGCEAKIWTDSRPIKYGGDGGDQIILKFLFFASTDDTISVNIGENAADCDIIEEVCSQWASSGESGETSFISINGVNLIEILGSVGGQGGWFSCSGNFPSYNGSQVGQGSYNFTQNYNNSGLILMDVNYTTNQTPGIIIRY